MKKPERRTSVPLEQLTWEEKLDRVQNELDTIYSHHRRNQQRNRFMRSLDIYPDSDEASVLDVIIAYEHLKHGQEINYDHDGKWVEKYSYVPSPALQRRNETLSESFKNLLKQGIRDGKRAIKKAVKW